MPNIGRLLAAVMAVSMLGVAPVSAAPAGASPPPADDTAITLITGDVVHATHDANGQWTLAMRPVEPATPAQYLQFQQRHGDTVDQYLIPQTAMPLVQSGVLDRELFDVTGLIRQGYDDAHSDATPLMVTDSAGQASKRVERKTDTAAFWRSLTG